MMRKKIMSVAVVMVTCFMMAFAVGSNVKAADIQVRRPICGNCGVGTIHATVGDWQSWYDIDEYRCKHGKAHGNDIKQERARTVTYKCTTCNIGTSKKETQTRVVCKGYN